MTNIKGFPLQIGNIELARKDIDEALEFHEKQRITKGAVYLASVHEEWKYLDRSLKELESQIAQNPRLQAS